VTETEIRFPNWERLTETEIRYPNWERRRLMKGKGTTVSTKRIDVTPGLLEPPLGWPGMFNGWGGELAPR
jgi:hypothetical protein